MRSVSTLAIASALILYANLSHACSQQPKDPGLAACSESSWDFIPERNPTVGAVLASFFDISAFFAPDVRPIQWVVQGHKKVCITNNTLLPLRYTKYLLSKTGHGVLVALATINGEGKSSDNRISLFRARSPSGRINNNALVSDRETYIQYHYGNKLDKSKKVYTWHAPIDQSDSRTDVNRENLLRFVLGHDIKWSNQSLVQELALVAGVGQPKVSNFDREVALIVPYRTESVNGEHSIPFSLPILGIENGFIRLEILDFEGRSLNAEAEDVEKKIYDIQINACRNPRLVGRSRPQAAQQ